MADVLLLAQEVNGCIAEYRATEDHGASGVVHTSSSARDNMGPVSGPEVPPDSIVVESEGGELQRLL